MTKNRLWEAIEMRIIQTITFDSMTTWVRYLPAILVAIGGLVWLNLRHLPGAWHDSAWAQIVRPVPSQPGHHELRLFSPRLLVDDYYPSMRGPYTNYYFELPTEDLCWLTGYEVQMQLEDEPQNLAAAFLCHNNFDYDLASHYKQWGITNRTGKLSSRFFTLSQGQQQVQFPAGFGIPLATNNSLSANAQVLNHHLPNANLQARQVATVYYTDAMESEEKMRPLFQQSIAVMPPVSGTVADGPEFTATAACAKIAAVSTGQIKGEGATFTGHWVVPPGRDTVVSNVTQMLQLPFATTLHYAGVHVHPYCESVRLFDLTDSIVVFTAGAETTSDRPGLESIDYFSSETGVKMFPSHAYELRCITNNTSGKNQDMMAVMLLYLYDKELDSILTSQLP